MSNRHHVLFPRAVHESTRINQELRTLPALIPRMDEDIHKDLHNNISYVPPLNHHMGQRVLYLMETGFAHDSVGSMRAYMRAVEESMDHPRVTDLDRMLGHLVIESVEAQIPFIQNSDRMLTTIDLGRRYRGKR